MAFQLESLPYAQDALAPHISAETLSFHYGKHHAGYVSKLNTIATANAGALAGKSLVQIITADPKTLPAGAFNCAAQTWNHTFYWKSLAPPAQGGGKDLDPNSELAKKIQESYGDMAAFKAKFSEVAGGHFASGWAWLVYEKSSKKVTIVDTHDAGCPLTDSNLVPLLTCDVWEHAYYIDYRNARPEYIKGKHFSSVWRDASHPVHNVIAWWNLVNWKFAEDNLKQAMSA